MKFVHRRIVGLVVATLFCLALVRAGHPPLQVIAVYALLTFCLLFLVNDRTGEPQIGTIDDPPDDQGP